MDSYDIEKIEIKKVTFHHSIFPRATDLHIKHCTCDLLVSALLCYILSASELNTEVGWKVNLCKAADRPSQPVNGVLIVLYAYKLLGLNVSVCSSSPIYRNWYEKKR